MPVLADEDRSFCALWRWVTGKELTHAELAVMRNPHDPPDFQFTREAIAIAVEHTQVFRPTSNASLRPLHDCAIQDRICDHLDGLLRQPNGQMPHVALSITFASCRMVRKEDEPTIARGVYDLIKKRMEAGNQLPMALYMCDLSDISACLGDLLVMNGGPSSTVGRHSFGRVDEWGLAIFEDAAGTKSKDLSAYYAKFDECWLLLSVGGPHRAQWVEPSPAACTRGVKTDFDRVFIVDHDHNTPRVSEIFVQA